MSTFESPRVDYVPARFDAIGPKVSPRPWSGRTERYLGANNAKQIVYPEYSSRIANGFGRAEHFQGVQRIRRFLVVTGGITNQGEQRSQLIAIAMGSRPATGPWSRPRYPFPHREPSRDDRIVAVVDIDRTSLASNAPGPLWHAGGIQAVGDAVAVPIYGGGRSQVRFFDCSRLPLAPTELPEARIELPREPTPKAAGVTRLRDGRYLAVIWDDVALRFFRSAGTALSDFRRVGRTPKSDIPHIMEGHHVLNSFTGRGSYQNVNLLCQADGEIYLMATFNTQRASPTFTGANYADLFHVEWLRDDRDQLRYDAAPEAVRRVRHREMFCYDQQANFGAAVGIHIEDSTTLFLYATYHWLRGGADDDRYLNFNEYTPQT